jgi:hypothetical protein
VDAPGDIMTAAGAGIVVVGAGMMGVAARTMPSAPA